MTDSQSRHSSLLPGKTAVLYGGGPISSGVARVFAREGAQVFMAGRNAERLCQIADQFRQNGAEIETHIVNASNEADVYRFVNKVVDSAGRIDISFNLVGIGDVQKPLESISAEEFIQPIVNATRSHFLTTNAAAVHMKRQGSGVVLIFGGGGPQTLPGLGGFKVALDALESLRRQFACEYGPHGVRVVTLKTGGVPETIPEDFPARDAIRESIEQSSLLGRAATLEDVGNVAAFAASDKAGTITAADINISCGSIIE